MLDPDLIHSRRLSIEAELATAAAIAGGSPARMLAAVKYLQPADLAPLAAAGVTLVGENRVEQLIEKQAAGAEGLVWHFIGHLQSRKARDLVGRVELIHSLSSLSAAERLQRFAEAEIGCLIEVNVVGEDSKSGLAPDGIEAFLEALTALDRIAVRGLMTMPPLANDPDASRGAFAALRELAEQLEQRWSGRHAFGELSMGTSQDYAVAAEEGATIVRVGSTLVRA